MSSVICGLSRVGNLRAEKETRETKHTEQLLSKELIESRVHKERENLNTQREVYGDRAV